MVDTLNNENKLIIAKHGHYHIIIKINKLNWEIFYNWKNVTLNLLCVITVAISISFDLSDI